MTTVEFLSHLRDLGVKLWVEEDRLRFRAPQNVMTAALKAQLAEHKANILAFLQQATAHTHTALPAITPVARDEHLRLSFAQERLWFFDQWQPGSSTYNLLTVVRLRGLLHVAVAQHSISEIVARHEALRTTFATIAEQPIQIIHPAAEVPLPVRDLQDLPTAEREAEAQRLVNQEAQRPFDLQRGPLVRATLLRLSATDHILMLNTHHVVSDGWSVGVLIQEFVALYTAGVRHQPAQLTPLPIQYADYAAWQRLYLEPLALDQQLAYWREQLKNVPALLELPTDRPRPAVQSFRGSREKVLIPPALAEQLTALSKQQGVTLFMTLLAAFQTLLYRYTAQTDIVVGSPVAGRSQPETQPLIGFFVNMLVLRAGFANNPAFLDLLRQVGDVTLQAHAHQDLPFEKLVETLQPERSSSHSPLFQVVFLLQHVSATTFALPDLTLSLVEMEINSAKMDLTLAVEERPDGLRATAEYNTDLFDAATIRRLLAHFGTLLAGIVADPQQPVATLPLLRSAEQQMIRHDWNATSAPFPQHACIHTLIETQAARTPDAIAVVCGDAALTYDALNARANRLAHQLRFLGVGPETRVGVCFERSVEMVVALLAVLKAGGCYVPLDPAYPHDRLQFMLDDSQAQVLITQQQMLDRLPALEAQLVCIDRDQAQIAAQPASPPPSEVVPGNLAYMIYTSGSTGIPKGVMITHRSAVNNLWWHQETCPLTSADRLLHLYSFSFDPSVWAAFWPLIAGAQVVIAPRNEQYDGAALIRLITRHQITFYGATPVVHSMLLDEPGMAACTSLRSAISGGDRMSGELQRRWFTQLGAELVNLYGPTEATIDATFWRCKPVEAPEAAPIGYPIANTQVRVLDARLQLVPVGVPGDLYIAGVSLARGYHRRPALTAERFIPDPFTNEPGARLYKTGDLARYRADGALEFLDRGDDQVKIRGFRIELGEIEAALLQHPSAREAVVLARADRRGEKQLIAYVVADDPSPSVNELRRFLQQSLPDHMVPAAFVLLQALPLSSNGKVDRKALPAPELERTGLESSFVAPRTPTEEVVAGVWAEVLGVSQVGAHDDFFVLGGHSLLATRIVARIRSLLQVEVPLRALFAAPTVAGLAGTIEAHWRQAQHSPPITALAERPARMSLSFAQQRLWFLEQLQPDTATYNMPTALRLAGELDTAALQHTLDAIVERHEVLRTTFALVDGEPIQMIHPPHSIDLPLIDLQSHPAAESEARQLVADAAMQPFNLETGPLLRTLLVRLQPDQHILLINMHHIVSDGWSMGIFVRELTTLYAAYAAGSRPALPPLPIQYADYALWQRQWIQGDVLEQQLGFWRQQLADVPVLNIPTDWPRPAEPTTRGANHDFLLDPALQHDLIALSRREGATVFMTLLAAFQTLLYRYTRQSDFAVGTPVAHRTRSETEELLGCFVNTLTLRARFSGRQTFRELMQQTREICLEAYAHQDLPFEQVVDALQPERNLSHHPLFQVMFTLQNAAPAAAALPGLSLSALTLAHETAKFDLSLFLAETEQGLAGGIEYSTDLFEAATIARMAEHFTALLAGIVANPDSPIDRLPILSAAEQQRIVIDWNITASPYPQPRCIHHLFEQQAARTPHATALIGGVERLSYAEVEQQATTLARLLQAYGVGPEVPVALCVERSPQMIIAMLAILKAGGLYIPLDPAYPAERLQFMLHDTQAPVLLTQQRLVATLPQSGAAVICLDQPLPTVAHDAQNLNAAVTPDNLAYVIYTSGSTGRPKGVAITHANAVALVDWAATIFTPAELAGVLAATSICFDLSVFEIFLPLACGGTVIVAENALALPQLPAADEVTLVNTVPSAMTELVRSGGVPASVRTVNLAGEPLKNALVQQIYRQPTIERVYNLYGPSEDTTYSTFTLIERGNSTEPTIGRPIDHTQAYVLDTEMQPVPVGVLGELYLGGAGLARGYLNRPDLSAETFVPDPFSGMVGARLYRTGDLARYLPDSTIEFLGRIDHQVKVRGFRIELGEIESRLLSHPAVREVVVLAREDIPPAGGHPDKRIVAYVVGEQASKGTSEQGNKEQGNKEQGNKESAEGPMPVLSASELRIFLLSQLPEYMVPAAFVLLPALPLTPNGKIDRKALPAPHQPEQHAGQDRPRDLVELQLAQIWQELLGLPAVGVRANFFELGGHSILAVRLMAQIRQRFDQQLPLATLFHGATIEQMAAVIRRQTGNGPTSPLVAIQPQGSKRPLFCVHPVGGNVFCYVDLANRLGPDQPLYAFQAASLIDQHSHDTSIEQMAARYIAALRTAQSHGPYQLGGWSMGGVIALEMAQQLQALGEEVTLLAMIDSFAGIGAPATDDELLVGFANDLGLPTTLITETKLSSADPREGLRQIVEQARRDGMIPPDVEFAQAAHLFEVYKTNTHALQRYVPRPYHGHLTLFKAGQQPAEAPYDAVQIWQGIATEGLSVSTLPGDHYSLLRAPHIAQLAEQLRVALHEAQTVNQA